LAWFEHLNAASITIALALYRCQIIIIVLYLAMISELLLTVPFHASYGFV
jgi:hypothetical protein